ncbi:MAG: DUF4831 family protein [Bacteroidales bacterium]
MRTNRHIGHLVVGLTMVFVVSCSTPSRFIVTGLGYEPSETVESVIYALPQTGLKVRLTYQKDILIPGPYADYAQKMLGIEGVRKDRSEKYTIQIVLVEPYTEPDGKAFYTVNSLEGQPDIELMRRAESNKLILRGNYVTDTDIAVHSARKNDNGIFFKDVTMHSNVEMQEHTIYKTLITDTSFVRVPLTTQQMERKTLEKKAEEAAKLILEIRSDRYYLSAGLVDPLPAGFDLKAAMDGLDRLEEEYLSLFIGKSYSEEFLKEYYRVPEGSIAEERFKLDHFSASKGIVAAEGNPIELVIAPSGNSRSFKNLLPQEPEPDVYNRIYYRIPEICDVSVIHSGRTLCSKRTSIYQSGALISEKAGE